MSKKKVIILDDCSMYGRMVDREVRELNVVTEILPLNTLATSLKADECQCIIISGDADLRYSDESPVIDPKVFKLGVPILGICAGMNYINCLFGGTKDSLQSQQNGQFATIVDCSCSLFRSLNVDKQKVFFHETDSIKDLANDFTAVGNTNGFITAIANERLKFFGVLFHPEFPLTVYGKHIFRAFLYDITGMTGTYTVSKREETSIQTIRSLVGSSKVVVLVSGGVNSLVLTFLLSKALNRDQVLPVCIDNGFMRKGEPDNVMKTLEKCGFKVKLIKASHRFYNSTTKLNIRETQGKVRKVESSVLCTCLDPENKHRIIGDTFINVVEDALKDMDLTSENYFLAQGSLRCDMLESMLTSSNTNSLISHHIDSDLMWHHRIELGVLIEPLDVFYKDDVRLLGTSLGISSDLLRRHPFPGSGLATRVLCADDPYICEEFAQTQTILCLIADYHRSLSEPHALLKKIHAALVDKGTQENLKLNTERFPTTATLLPIKTLGIQSIGRTFGYAVALSSENPNPNWENLFFMAEIILLICQNINHVVYVFGDVVQGSFEDVTPTHLSSNVIATIRQCDYVANEILAKHDEDNRISQMPVILLPLHFDRDFTSRFPSCQRSVVLRPFVSNDFVTGVAARPGKDILEDVVKEMVAEVKKVPGISRVLYDLTSKPPGTAEWE